MKDGNHSEGMKNLSLDKDRKPSNYSESRERPGRANKTGRNRSMEAMSRANLSGKNRSGAGEKFNLSAGKSPKGRTAIEINVTRNRIEECSSATVRVTRENANGRTVLVKKIVVDELKQNMKAQLKVNNIPYSASYNIEVVDCIQKTEGAVEEEREKDKQQRDRDEEEEGEPVKPGKNGRDKPRKKAERCLKNNTFRK